MTNEEMFRIEKNLNDGIVRIEDVRSLLYNLRQAQGKLETMATEAQKYKDELNHNMSRHHVTIRITSGDVPIRVENYSNHIVTDDEDCEE